MNATINTSENADRQAAYPRYCPPRPDPLRAAQLHTAAQRLDLRRVRRDLVGSHKIATVDRLLDVNAAVARSLEWLNGKAEAVPDDFAAPGQLAIEVGAVAEGRDNTRHL